jgi:DNA (cytosine-5)-methyltransferase 1
MDASAGSVLPTPTSQAAKHGATPDTTANAYGKNLWDLPHLLPTPTAVDMGRGKTVDEWDEWTDRMRAEHANGNGHGRSLEIEAMKLLPTPTCQDGANNGGPSQFNGHALPLNTLVTTFPDSDPTPTPSPDGNPLSDDPHPTPPTTSDD